MYRYYAAQFSVSGYKYGKVNPFSDRPNVLYISGQELMTYRRKYIFSFKRQ